MAKEPQELKWIESLLPEEGLRRKAMFGGFAYYIDEKMILATFESPGDSTYRGEKFAFEVWNGCMFPVEKEFHPQALTRFPFLIPHPVLPKWLYLPVKTEGFDDLVSEVLEQIKKPHSYWGSIPKGKNKKASKKVKEEKISTNLDTRKPRMFSDEPADVTLQKAQKISDLKNLGPTAEQAFHKAGIKTAQKFIQMGWKKALVKLVQANPKNRHAIFAYALIGALENKEWNLISDKDKLEARNFVKSLPVAKKKKKA